MTRAQAAVGVTAVALAIGCVLLMVEAGRRLYRTLGPSHAVAAADGSLYVVSHGRIHVFARDGERRQVIDLRTLGVATKPSDIALHADGRIALMDPDTSLVQRCRLPRGPCEALDLGLQRSDMQQLMPLNAAKLAIDERAQRYYVSDNAGQRLVIADFSGHVLARSAPRTVWYPNHLFVAAPGELSVVDTNHHRIATFDVHGDRVGRLLREVAADSSPVTRPGRQWPFDSAPMPGGETAVLIAADRMRDADLVVLDPSGTAVRRFDLGADSDPFDIERWGDRIVVADGTRYRLQALDFDGRPVAGFPRADFLEELSREHARARLWAELQLAARIGLVAVPLLAIVVLWRMGVPLVPPAPAPVVPNPANRARGVQWIAYDPAFVERDRRRSARLAWGVLPATFIALALFMWLFASAAFTRWGLVHLGPTLLLLALAPFLLVRGQRDVQRRRSAFRMGASDEGLRVVAAGARGAETENLVPWTEVYTDGMRLLAGTSLVMLRHPAAGDMFDRQALADAILSRIPPANVLGPARFAMQAARARPRESLLVAAAILLCIGLLGARRLGLL